MIIERRLFVFLTLGFIGATIVGTLSHESGHYIAAKLLGYDASINYAFTKWSKTNPNQIIDPRDTFWITLGGPLQTILTGTTGLLLLLTFRKTFNAAKANSLGQWFLIFMSLFWLRQTANFVNWIMGYFLNGKFSERNDEVKLAIFLQLPHWVITFTSAVIGAGILILIVLKFIPDQHQATFLLAGFLGGISGYILWLYLLGPIVMP